MYIENGYIYAEHNMSLVCNVTGFNCGHKVTVNRKVKYSPDGTSLPEYVNATMDYYHEVVDYIAVQKEIEQQILDLKAQLAATDYQCLKWCEGYLTDDEYQPIRDQRQKLRNEINELEAKLA